MMDFKIKNMLLQARKPNNVKKVWGYKKQLPLLTLLHFSDAHGDDEGMKRLCDFMDEYGDNIEDCICTGDILEGSWTSDFEFWKQGGRANKILSCIGNHDILPEHVNWDWSKRISQEDCYKRMFAPFIEEWNCVYEENKTFYYKDYEANAIRLIVLNSMLIDEELEEQLAWFEKTLDSALEKEYHVVVAMHYPVYMKKIPCNFSSLDSSDCVGDKSMEIYQEKVDVFSKKGGDFVTWLAGHVHFDYVGYSEKYPDQLCITIDALRCYQGMAYDDFDRTEGMPSQDLYNLVTFDTHDKMIKIIRIGCDVDRYLRKRDTLCINYKTFEIIK